MSDILYLLDFSTFLFGIVGLIITVFTGLLNKKFKLNMNRALQISFISVITIIFTIINIISIIDFSRLVTISLILSAVIPLLINFFIIWTNINDSTITRIQIVSFISWWITLLVTGTLRLFLGWGEFSSIYTLVVIAVLFTIITGIIGGLLGNIVLIQIEKIQSSK